MSNHLPECPGNWGVGQMPEGPCTFCEMLRACEERIKTHEGCADAERVEGYSDGYSDGLDAARKAVGDLPHPMIDVECECGACAALAAIDALREKP